MKLFETGEAYEIAKKICKGRDYYKDLAHHVFLAMQTIPNIENEKALFIYLCNVNTYQADREFYRNYKWEFDQIKSVAFKETATEETLQQKIFRDYLEEKAKSIKEWVNKEVIKLLALGHSERKIESLTGVSRSSIRNIKKSAYNDIINIYNTTSNSINNSNS